MRAKHVMLATASVTALVAVSPSFAQTTPNTQRSAAPATEEVIVTSRKREERLQEVPISALAFGGEQLKIQAINNSRDLFEITPGVTFIDNGSNNRSEVIIRGAGTGRLANTEAGNGLYRNGAFAGGGSFGGRSFSRMDFVDVDRIEVLRGPQGALYGRNAVGGAVALVNTRPKDSFGGSVAVSGGSQQSYGLTGILNAPVVANKLAARLAFIVDRQDSGFFKNPNYTPPPVPIPAEFAVVIPGDKQRLDGVRFSIAADPIDKLSLDFAIDSYREEGPSQNLFLFDATGGTAGPFSQVRPPQDPFTAAYDTAMVTTVNETTGNFTAKWESPVGEVVSITSYKWRSGTELTDTDANTASLYTAPPRPKLTTLGKFTSAYQQWTQEARISNTAFDDRLKWMAGVDYISFRDKIQSQVYGAPGVVTQTGVTVALRNNLLSGQVNDITPVSATSWAVFGSLEYALTPQLSATVEARTTHDEKTINSLRQRGDGVILPIIAQRFVQTQTTDQTSPGVSLRYEFTPDLMVYGRYGTAFRAGGFNFNRGTWVTIAPPNPPSYDAEKVGAFEIGTRTQWFDRALTVNLSAYRQDFTDLLFNRQQADQAALPQQINWLENGGDATVYGVEFEVAGRISLPSAFYVDSKFYFTHQQGEVTKSKVPAILVGIQPTFLRDYQSSLDIQLNRPFGADLRGFLGVTGAGAWGGITSPVQQIPRKDYFTTSFRAGVVAGPWTFRANVRNAFDERHYIIRQSNPLDRSNSVNLPRTYSVELTYRF